MRARQLAVNCRVKVFLMQCAGLLLLFFTQVVVNNARNQRTPRRRVGRLAKLNLCFNFIKQERPLYTSITPTGRLQLRASEQSAAGSQHPLWLPVKILTCAKVVVAAVGATRVQRII